MTIPTTLIEQMLDWAHTHRPDRLLLVASPGHPLASALDNSKTATTITHIDPPRAVASDRLGSEIYDLAIVCDALETQSKRDAQRLMSRLRDVQARAVIVAAAPSSTVPPNENRWTSSDFIALGFKRCRTTASVSDWQVYRFNIYDYKDTPTWLNARHWANPEQWGRHRW